MGILAKLRRRALNLPFEENPEEIKEKLILTKPLLVELRKSFDHFARFTQFYSQLKKAAELSARENESYDFQGELGKPPTQEYYERDLQVLGRLKDLLSDLNSLEPSTKIQQKLANIQGEIEEVLAALEWYMKNYKKILALHLALIQAPHLYRKLTIRQTQGVRFRWKIKREIRNIKKAYEKLTSTEPGLVANAPINSINNVIIWISVLGERYDVVLSARDKKENFHAPEAFVHWTGDKSWGLPEIKDFVRTGIIPQYQHYTPFNASYFPGWVSFYARAGSHLENLVGFLLDPGWVKKHAREFRCAENSSQKVLQLCRRWGIPIGIESEKAVYFSGFYRRHAGMADEVQHYGSVPYRAISGIICPDYQTQRAVIFFLCKLAQRDPALIIPVYGLRGEMVWP